MFKKRRVWQGLVVQGLVAGNYGSVFASLLLRLFFQGLLSLALLS